ncbi:TonB-dependent receptor [Candidatus Dependentiae bacterium]|nr:TonB-dependent receptor [Candidatus Dependentiae bacterium]
MKRQILTLLFVGIMITSSFAQEEKPFSELDIFTENELQVVTASKHLQKISEAPATIYVITEEDIRIYGYLDLKDALKSIPGIEISDPNTQIFGGQRGFSSNFSQTLLLIDGREMENLIAAETFIHNQFATHNIKQIEVVMGPASALYGANAYVGVINIITKSRDPEFEGIIFSSEGGSYNTEALNLIFAKNFSEDGRLSGSFRFYRSNEEDFTDFVSDTQNFSPGNPTNSFRPLPKNCNEFIYANPSSAIPLNFEISYKNVYTGVEYYRNRKGFGLEMVQFDYANTDDQRDLRLFYIGYKRNLFNNNLKLNIEYQDYYETCHGTMTDVTRNLYVGNFDELETILAGLSDYEKRIFLLRETQRSFSACGSKKKKVEIKTIYNFPNISNTLITGLDYEKCDIVGFTSSYSPDRQPPFIKENQDADAFHNNKKSFFIQDQQTFLDKFVLTIGGRIDRQNLYGTVITPRGGMVYKITERSNIKALFGKAFREPNVFELKGRQAITGKFDLKPANITTYEISYSQYFGKFLFNQVTVYLSDAEDLIRTALIPGFGERGASNVGSLTVKGLEDVLKIRYKNFAGFLTFCFTDIEDETVEYKEKEDSIVVNKEMKVGNLNVPEYRINLGASYDIRIQENNFTISILDHWVDRITAQYNDLILGGRSKPFEIDAFHEVSLTFSGNNINFSGLKLDFFLTIQNLFNSQFYHPNVRFGPVKMFEQEGRRVYLRMGLIF